MKNFKTHAISAFHTFLSSFLIIFLTMISQILNDDGSNLLDIFSVSSVMSTAFVAVRAAIKEVLPIFISSLKNE
jgi:hypothetical protein